MREREDFLVPDRLVPGVFGAQADLFRSKGVLAVAGAEERYVFQVREAGAGKAGAWRVAQPAPANHF